MITTTSAIRRPVAEDFDRAMKSFDDMEVTDDTAGSGNK